MTSGWNDELLHFPALPRGNQAALAVVVDQGKALLRRGEDARAVTWTINNLLLLKASYGDQIGYAELYNILGNGYRNLGYFEKAVDYSIRAEAEAKQGNDAILHGKTLLTLGSALAEVGEYDNAIAQFTAGLERLQQAGDLWGVIAAKNNLGWTLGQQGKFEQAAALLGEVVAWAREHGDQGILGPALESQASLYARTARTESAVALYREALTALADTPRADGYVQSLAGLAEILLDQGHPEDALRELGPLPPDQGGPNRLGARLGALRARALEQLGRWEEACAEYRKLGAYNADAARGQGAVTYQRTQVNRLEHQLAQRLEQQSRVQEKLINALAAMAEARDGITGAHVRRTSRFVTLLAEELHRQNVVQIDSATVRLYGLTSVLHDIGKIGIPDAILSKPGPLTDEEFTVMRTHVTIGEQMIASIPWEESSEEYVRCLHDVIATHHERWDGQGYPRGLRGTEIPLIGRIMAVGDVYDALRSERPYKKGMDHSRAVGIIAQGSGTQFDPAVASAFLVLESDFAAAYDELAHEVRGSA